MLSNQSKKGAPKCEKAALTECLLPSTNKLFLRLFR